MPSLFILLLSLGVSLRFSYNTSHGAAATPVVTSPPPTPPYHQHHHLSTPGNKVVVVVHNEPSGSKLGSAPLPRPLLTSESQQRKEKRSNRKSIFLPAGINRQGFLLAKPTTEETNKFKNRKGPIQKIVQASPRHISSGGPSDVFGKPFHIHKTGASFDKINGNNPSVMEFRPHQPDITPDPQTGKLPLPVGYANDALSGIKHFSHAPMANQINPYTNGVASSFPPGIDPYEGFIRYAAENLDSPMGNMIDYHSLEHYYGPQHPLSPHHNMVNVGKENNLDNHPYADSFAYGGKQGGSSEQIGNSPPLSSPPPPVGTAGTNVDGFRARDNPENNGPSSGFGGGSDYNSLSPYGHGIDHFHAPSPGLGSAPPIPRYVATTEATSEEDEHENSPPSPHYRNMPPRPPFPGGPPNSPFKTSASSRIPPPDLKVFEEGPPPELLGNSPPGPPGPHGHGSGPPDRSEGPPGRFEGPPDGGGGPPDRFEGPPERGEGPPRFGSGSHGPGAGPPPSHQHEHQRHEHQPSHSDSEQGMTPQDGGDDSIWGILDIAEMLEKGQLPGTSNDNNRGSSPAANNRVVIPAYTGASPQKGYGGEGPSSASSPFEYDDGGAGEGGNGAPHNPHSHYTPQESEEANDYEDQYSK